MSIPYVVCGILCLVIAGVFFGSVGLWLFKHVAGIIWTVLKMAFGCVVLFGLVILLKFICNV